MPELNNEETAATGDTTTRRRTSNPRPGPPVALDGGYGWVIVFASFINHVIVDGICYTFGTFYVEFLEHFGESKGKTSFVGSALAGILLITAPFASILANKFGCRSVAAVGAVIAAFGFAVSRFSTSINGLMVTYGVISGIGFGLLYLPSVVIVSYYFERRRALATGIAVSGAGFGTFIFAPLGRFLLTHLDWKNSMLVVAGITAQGCVTSFLLRPIESYQHSRPKTIQPADDFNNEGSKLSLEMNRLDQQLEGEQTSDYGESVSASGEQRDDYNLSQSDLREMHTKARQLSLLNVQLNPEVTLPLAKPRTWPRTWLARFVKVSGIYLLSDPLFVIPFLANLCAMTGLYIPFYFVISRALTLGIEQTMAAFLVSLIGVTNIVGRIVSGFFADLDSVSPLLLHNLALLFNGVLCLLNMFCINYPLMCAYSLLIGLGMATWISLTPVVLCDLLGVQKLAESFGLLTMARGVSALIGPPIAGFVYDVTLNYDNSFHVAGVMFLIGGTTCCLLHLPVLQKRTYANSLNSDVGEAVFTRPRQN